MRFRKFIPGLLCATLCIPLEACKTDEDCSLNGLCLSTHSHTASGQGVCKCDEGWYGDDCGWLDLSPATRWTGYNQTNTTSPGDFGNYGNSSWGGQIVQDPTNRSVFHLFASQFSHGCGLSGWRPHSFVMRAESTTGPRGPYHFVEAVTGGFRHNTDVIFSPHDCKYLLYTIGVDIPDPTECTSISIDEWPNNISVASADKLQGPWTDPKVIVVTNKEKGIHATNPSAFPMWSADNPTGEIALGIKDYTMFKAKDWDAAYEKVYTADWNVTELYSPLWTEDTFIWRDKRGNWHSLNHWMIDIVENDQKWPRVGSHAFARNLEGPWHYDPQHEAFNSSVEYTDGSFDLFKRRERPKLYFSDDGHMTPLYLITGVQQQDETARSFTLIQPIGTEWESYEKRLGF